MKLPNPRKPKHREVLVINPDNNEHVRVVIN